MKGFLDDDFDEDMELNSSEEQRESEEEGSTQSPLVVGLTFAGLIVLAAIICAVLWHFTHLDKPADAEPEESVTETVADGEIPEETVADEREGLQSEDDSNSMDIMQEDTVTEEAVEPISGNTSMEFTEVEDQVTAKEVTNLRSAPSTLDTENIVAQFLNGEALTRTGVNESTGWSRLLYKGKIVYAVTQYLTTDLMYRPVINEDNPNRITTIEGRVILFTDCDDKVTPKEYVNLRTEPSTTQGQDTVRCQIKSGEAVKRTGISHDSGWSRVEYNGETLYVVSSYMKTAE